MASTHNYLPEDLMLKIFLPQTVKSLLRSRCVCKYWNEFISSKSFIKSHLAHQKTSLNANKFLLLDYCGSYTTSLVDSGSYDKILESRKFDVDDIVSRATSYYTLEIYGICDGLLCLSHYKTELHSESMIILWNPIARKGKKLPPIGIHRYGSSFLCFGYHDEDYKVIHVVSYKDSYHVYIYGLNMDDWKLIKFDMSNYTIYGEGLDSHSALLISPCPKARLVNGVAYFLRRYYFKNPLDGRVVFFDLSREITGEIKLPDDFHFAYDFIMEKYEESVALIGYSQTRTQDVVMWVLKVSDNSFSWDKKFAITTQVRFPKLMGLIIDDKLVINIITDYASSCTDEYTLYNVENGFRQEVTSTPKGLEKKNRPCRIHDFTESLLLLNETTTPFPEVLAEEMKKILEMVIYGQKLSNEFAYGEEGFHQLKITI